MAYLTQAEAAVYVPVVADLSTEQATAFLDLASEMIDNACGRTFDTVLETLPVSIKMAVAIMANELTQGADLGRDASSERIGDYAVTYGDKASSGMTSTSIPDSVMTLIAPYKALIVG